MIQIVHAPSGTNVQQGDAIPNGSIIRLQHVRTRKWLHSHLHQSPISGNLEVGGFLYCLLCDVSCQHNLSVSSVTDSRHSQWIPILLFSKSPLPFEISQGSGWLLLAWAKGKTSLVLSSLPRWSVSGGNQSMRFTLFFWSICILMSLDQFNLIPLCLFLLAEEYVCAYLQASYERLDFANQHVLLVLRHLSLGCDSLCLSGCKRLAL
jgi:hypothetical protein